MRRLLSLSAALALLITALGAGPVLATASNDTVANATAVALPSTTNEDTTVADATDPAETALNGFCGAPVVEHGVWFKLTAGADGFVAFDTSGADYSAGLMAFDGTPAPDGLLTCGPQTIVVEVASGHTYNVLVFGDGLTAETSGNLVLDVREATPAPSVDLTVNRSGTVDKFNTVHLWGTATCTSTNGTGQVIEIFGSLRQRVGRQFIDGFFDTSPSITCDGTPQRWDAFGSGDNGLFAGGKAATVAIGVGCTDLCSEGFIETTIQLKRSGK